MNLKIVNTLIEKISGIRKTRNLFIHGVWSEPYESNNDILIVCDESKLDYSEEKQDGKIVRRRWISKKSTTFRVCYIRTLVDKVEEILLIEDHLIKKLEDYNYNEY